MQALIDKRENKVVQIVEDSEIFQVHENLIWVHCYDSKVETGWSYNFEREIFIDPFEGLRDEFGNVPEPWIMQRSRAYPPIGDQLDLLYKEVIQNGSISADGPWARAIAAAKAAVPKPNNS